MSLADILDTVPLVTTQDRASHLHVYFLTGVDHQNVDSQARRRTAAKFMFGPL